MATLSYPGVYMEEVSSGVRPIAAAGTSTAAFVGMTEKGPDDQAMRVTNWTQFQKHYGTFIPGSYLAESVFQFFNNGGSQCYIARVTKTGAAAADVTLKNRAATAVNNGLKFSAKNKGDWGNYLYLQIEDGTNDPGNTFKVTVRKQDVKDFVPEDFLNTAPLEVHDNLSMDADSPNYAETLLNKRSNLISVKVLAENISTQNGFHRGGPDPALTPSTITNPKFEINIDNDGFRKVSITGFTSLGQAATAIQTGVRAMSRLKNSTSANAYSGFTCSMADNRMVLTSGTNNAASSVQVKGASTDNAAPYFKLGEPYGGVSEDGLAVRRPANADTVQIGDNAVTGAVTAVNPGNDGSGDLNEQDYAGAFPRFDNITDFSLLAVPGIGSTTMVDMGMGYCKNRELQDVFYIGDMAKTDDTPSQAEMFRKLITQPNSYGAVYFPWVKALDPSGKSEEPILLPPSGYMAGLYARTDSKRGVWKAPAGTEASVNGVVGLAANLTDVEQGNLNRININCIRRFAGSGIVSWGARTITSNAEWTYIPVRRMSIMLRVSIYNGLQWAVFEPNDGDLWGQIRLNLNSFMMNLFRQGAFQGSSPNEAFFVKCDGETTTQDDIDLGKVNVMVGFAPLKPAEFVVVKISQKAGQSS